MRTVTHRRTVRRLLRALAALVVALAGLILVTPAAPASAGEAPEAVGWWSRQLPFQDSSTEGAGAAGAEDVTGQSVGGPVRFAPASGPAQVPPLPVPTTLPGQGPVTVPPPPVAPPTLPAPPITTPSPEEGTPNPSVPDGGLWVANDPTGAYAISALRFRGDIGAGELRLTFAPGSPVAGPIVACPVLNNWAPGPDGAWRDRAALDCDRFSISGNYSPDRTQVFFSIPQGFSEFGERTLDIGLAPDPRSGEPFNYYFEAPDETSFEVLEGQVLPPPVSELPEPDPLTLPTTIPVEQGGFEAPPVPSDPTPTPVPSDEQAAPETVDLGGGGSPLPQPIAELFEPFTESRAGRILSVLVLFGIGVGLWYLGGQPAREPRLLGALAGSSPTSAAGRAAPTVEAGQGIGRFRRERIKPPTRF